MPALAMSVVQASGLDYVVDFLAAHWLLFMFFWGVIAGLAKGFRDFFLKMARAALGSGERRHQRRLELARVRHGDHLPAVAREDGSVVTAPRGGRPGPCPHRPRNVRAVMGIDGELKGWLCTACDTQLPPAWAVLEEDL